MLEDILNSKTITVEQVKQFMQHINHQSKDYIKTCIFKIAKFVIPSQKESIEKNPNNWIAQYFYQNIRQHMESKEDLNKQLKDDEKDFYSYIIKEFENDIKQSNWYWGHSRTHTMAKMLIPILHIILKILYLKGEKIVKPKL